MSIQLRYSLRFSRDSPIVQRRKAVLVISNPSKIAFRNGGLFDLKGELYTRKFVLLLISLKGLINSAGTCEKYFYFLKWDLRL